MKRIFTLSVLILMLGLTSCTKRYQEKIIGTWHEEGDATTFVVTETYFDGSPYSIKGSRLTIDDETYGIELLNDSKLEIRVDAGEKVTFIRE